MRPITKGPEPQSLAQYRNEVRANDSPICSEHWDSGFKDKATAREYLGKEQGNLCAYCMKRIDPKDALRTKIEHWIARSDRPECALDWSNLLGVCAGSTPINVLDRSGDEKQKPEHCDTARGSQTLYCLHPADPAPLRRLAIQSLQFSGLGDVSSGDPQAKSDIHTLNLNHPQLRRNRAAVIDLIMVHLPNKQSWTRALLQRERAKWVTCDQFGSLREYCEVAIRWLDRQIQRRP